MSRGPDGLSAPISCCLAVTQQLDVDPGGLEAGVSEGRSAVTHPEPFAGLPPGPPGSAGAQGARAAVTGRQGDAAWQASRLAGAPDLERPPPRRTLLTLTKLITSSFRDTHTHTLIGNLIQSSGDDSSR